MNDNDHDGGLAWNIQRNSNLNHHQISDTTLNTCPKRSEKEKENKSRIWSSVYKRYIISESLYKFVQIFCYEQWVGIPSWWTLWYSQLGDFYEDLVLIIRLFSPSLYTAGPTGYSYIVQVMRPVPQPLDYSNHWQNALNAYFFCSDWYWYVRPVILVLKCLKKKLSYPFSHAAKNRVPAAAERDSSCSCCCSLRLWLLLGLQE